MPPEKIYIGTKIVAAEPMSDFDFTENVRPIPGHHLTGSGFPGYKVRYEDGYISWSPKETFERAYREVTAGERKMLAS